jgi:hypothetical protein
MSLGKAGKALQRAVQAGIPDGWELDEREVEMLDLAARQADDLERLETAISEAGAMVAGSTGQPVVNPAIPEARQARIAISRLLGALQLPDAEDSPRSAASERARKAARVRWERKDDFRRRRRGAA